MEIVRKLFRKFYSFQKSTFSSFRVLALKLLYSDVSIDRKSTIENNCKISCMNGGVLKIKNSHISKGTLIEVGDNAFITIVDSFIGQNSVITAGESIIIESNCLIAEMVTIRDHNHGYKDTSIPMNQQKNSSKKIHIKPNVWVGCKSTILKGCTLQEGTILAANSVLNSDTVEYSIYGGVTAKKIKSLVRNS